MLRINVVWVNTQGQLQEQVPHRASATSNVSGLHHLSTHAQYSLGNNTVVTLRSASVMIHTRSPATT